MPNFRTGYLFVALISPGSRRPLVKALAYGSSIPHIDATDLLCWKSSASLQVKKMLIADLAEESAAERARADVLERELATDAGNLVDRFIAGDMARFVTTRAVGRTE